MGSIPVGITGLALEHLFRTVFAKPAAAAGFLIVNGVILLSGERLRRASSGVVSPEAARVDAPNRQLDTMEMKEAAVIGAAQTAALGGARPRGGVRLERPYAARP